MKTKILLFMMLATLLIGAGCEKECGNTNTCYYCAKSDFVKKIDNVDGIIVYYEEINRYIISIKEEDINNLNVQEWNSKGHSSDYIYIPYVDLPRENKENGQKVIIVSGELYSCYPILPAPEYKIHFRGYLLKNYTIEKK
ncbi:MAG: hypothetical protein GXY75_05280 [Bacteroidales bacterium]|nr:hypothetical protein [Bacteroidales bacterium]